MVDSPRFSNTVKAGGSFSRAETFCRSSILENDANAHQNAVQGTNLPLETSVSRRLNSDTSIFPRAHSGRELAAAELGLGDQYAGHLWHTSIRLSRISEAVVLPIADLICPWIGSCLKYGALGRLRSIGALAFPSGHVLFSTSYST